MLQESFPLIFKLKEIEILKNMLVKIWLLWIRQVMWTVTCHIKLFPDNFLEKVAKFGSVCFITEKVINIQSRCGQNPPTPPPHPPV